MKSLVFACIITTAACTTSMAQEAMETNPKPLIPKKNEIGLMAETSFNNNIYAGNLDFRGLQYKRWIKPNMGYRVIAAYGEYYESNKPVVDGKFGDTVVQIARQTAVPNGTIGIGIDMQRKFYKRVTLFAAVELRGTYGRGHSNFVTSEYVENNPNNQYSNTRFSPDENVSLLSIAAAPTIGAKIEFNRFGFGTELSAIQMNYTNVTYDGAFSKNDNINTLDLNAGLFRQRFFIYYRF